MSRAGVACWLAACLLFAGACSGSMLSLATDDGGAGSGDLGTPRDADPEARDGDVDERDAGLHSRDAELTDLIDGTDSGARDAATSCPRGLTFGECIERGCETATCGCAQVFHYLGCFLPGEPLPSCAPCALPCAGRATEAACAADPSCVADFCTDCAVEPFFVACRRPDQAPFACGNMVCPCAGLGHDECASALNCHRVFVPGPTYSHCADGPYADCTGGAVTCNETPPVCDLRFTVAHRDGCYDGCVHGEDCPL